MKKTFFILFFLIFSKICFAQGDGVVFFDGNWSAVIAKAKKDNKPIYVDFFTDWCGPCKMMDKQFFPTKAVGDLLNNNFVAYHIDAEKGEGVELARKYQITAYPSSVFITYEGIAFHRMVGFPGIEKGVAEIKKAENIYYTTASKRMEELDAAFLKGERSYEFVNEYFKRKIATGGDLNEIKDSYLTGLNDNAKLEARNLKLVLNSPVNLRSKLYNFLSNQIEVDALKLPIETQTAINSGIELANTNAKAANDYELMKLTNAANAKVNDFLKKYLNQRNITEKEIKNMDELVLNQNLERTLNFFEKTERYKSMDSLVMVHDKILKLEKKDLKQKDEDFFKEFSSKSASITAEQRNTDYYRNFENQQKQYFTKQFAEKYLSFAKHYLYFKKDKTAIQKSINFLNESIKLEETDTKLRALSEAYLIKGDKKKAMATINKAIELNPESLELQLFQLKIEE